MKYLDARSLWRLGVVWVAVNSIGLAELITIDFTAEVDTEYESLIDELKDIEQIEPLAKETLNAESLMKPPKDRIRILCSTSITCFSSNVTVPSSITCANNTMARMPCLVAVFSCRR